MTIFANAQLDVTAPNEDSLMSTAAEAIREARRLTELSATVKVNLRYMSAVTDVFPGSTPEGVVASLQSKLNPSYGNDDTYQ